VLDTDEATFEKVMDVNVKGTFLLSKAALPGMIARKAGVIVNTASIAGVRGIPQRAAYTASKHAIVGLTRAMALDHVRDGIRVNCVCPGTVDTPWVGRLLAQAADPSAARAALVARQPMGRLGRAEEMAAAILFLAGEESSFTTGTALLVDGGFTA
jgi:NAD(P)-dependent dehydrogenase (short-subunit alcohol dehydrogenase family)